MVAVRSDPVDSGVVAPANPPRLVRAAAARGYAVAGSNPLWWGSSARPSSAASSPRAVPAIPTDGCGSASGWASPYNTLGGPTPPTRGLLNQEPSWLP